MKKKHKKQSPPPTPLPSTLLYMIQSLIKTIFSIVLDNDINSETGRKFSFNWRSSFLKIGITFANFHIDGNIPLERDAD